MVNELSEQELFGLAKKISKWEKRKSDILDGTEVYFGRVDGVTVVVGSGDHDHKYNSHPVEVFSGRVSVPRHINLEKMAKKKIHYSLDEEMVFEHARDNCVPTIAQVVESCCCQMYSSAQKGMALYRETKTKFNDRRNAKALERIKSN